MCEVRIFRVEVHVVCDEASALWCATPPLAWPCFLPGIDEPDPEGPWCPVPPPPPIKRNCVGCALFSNSSLEVRAPEESRPLCSQLPPF